MDRREGEENECTLLCMPENMKSLIKHIAYIYNEKVYRFTRFFFSTKNNKNDSHPLFNTMQITLNSYLFTIWHSILRLHSFLARDSIYAIARSLPSPVRLAVRLSVCLSVTRVDQSKTVHDRITQSSPQSSPMTLVSWRGMAPWNSNGNIGSGGAEYERGMKKRHFSHCRYCIPIHQAALLSRADPGVSRAFLYRISYARPT